jgi:hypothetical protein
VPIIEIGSYSKTTRQAFLTREHTKNYAHRFRDIATLMPDGNGFVLHVFPVEGPNAKNRHVFSGFAHGAATL